MRGVRYVTYSFVAILATTILVSVWLGRFQTSNAKRHTDTFLRILSSCSILLTFVFYYNLVKSEDDARIRGEEEDTNHELDRRSSSRAELMDLYKQIPNSVLSIVELCPQKKYRLAKRALELGELDQGLTEYRLKSAVFDVWVSDINLFVHRSPSMVNQVARMITQAISPILRVAWKEYSYQYSKSMNDFVEAVYVVIDRHIYKDAAGTPKYVELALEVLSATGHLDVRWDSEPPFYIFKEVQYLNDQVKHYF